MKGVPARGGRGRGLLDGDGHFGQGDGEVCVTAMEMGATAPVATKSGSGTAPFTKPGADGS